MLASKKNSKLQFVGQDVQFGKRCLSNVAYANSFNKSFQVLYNKIQWVRYLSEIDVVTEPKQYFSYPF